jgi:DNA-directed RNA polymerase specialized sigma24 family protein
LLPVDHFDVVLSASKDAFVQQVKTLETHDFFREALLLRMCFHGLSLKSALPVPRSYFLLEAITRDDGDKNQSAFDSAAIQLDFDFPVESGLLPVAAILRKVVSLRSEAYPDEQHWLAAPLFGSRKGSKAIEPRTAQRLLQRATKACQLHGAFGFRQAFFLGRRLHALKSRSPMSGTQQQSNSVDNCVSTSFEMAMKSIRWFFLRTFSNPHDREEAEQETRLRFWRFLTLSRGSTEAFKLHNIALRIAKCVYHSFLKAKISRPETLFSHFDAVPDFSSSLSRTIELEDDISFLFRSLGDTESSVINYFIRGLSAREISTRLAIPQPRIWRLRRLALRKLRKLLNRDRLALTF